MIPNINSLNQTANLSYPFPLPIPAPFSLSIPLPHSAGNAIPSSPSINPSVSSAHQLYTYGHSTQNNNLEYDKAVQAYYENTLNIRFFDTYRNTQIYTTTSIEEQKLKLKLNHVDRNSSTNYLLEISKDEIKVKELSLIFEEFKVRLIEGWSSLKPLFSHIIEKNAPHIVFNLDDFEENDFYKIVKPILDFKDSIISKNLLSELELKVIITIICDTLNVFMTKNNHNFLAFRSKEINDLFFLIDILILRGNALNFQHTKKMQKLGLNVCGLFFSFFLSEYRKISIGKILGCYKLHCLFYSKDQKINKFFTLSKDDINTNPTYSESVLILYHSNTVFLHALRFYTNHINLPTKVGRQKMIKSTNPIFIQISQLKQILSQGQISEFDQLAMFPNLLIDPGLTTPQLDIALNKYLHEAFEKPIYCSSLMYENSIFFIPIDHPHLANVKINSLKQLFDETLPNLPELIPPTYAPVLPSSSSPMSTVPALGPTSHQMLPLPPSDAVSTISSIGPSALPSSAPTILANVSSMPLAGLNPMENVPSLTFKDSFISSSQIFTITNLAFFNNLEKTNLKTAIKLNTNDNYLFNISNDPQKMSFLSRAFNAFKTNLTLIWGEESLQIHLKESLMRSNPFFQFDLANIPLESFDLLISPFLKFKSLLNKSQLFTNVEINIIMIILFQSLNISLSIQPVAPPSDNFKDLVDISEILKLAAKHKTNGLYYKVVNLEKDNYIPLISLYLYKVDKISFEKILSEFELLEARNNRNIIAFQLRGKFQRFNSLYFKTFQACKLMIVPKIENSIQNLSEVSIFPLEFKFSFIGIPCKYSHGSMNFEKSTEDLYKLIHISTVEPYSEFDKIEMFPTLLVDKRCDSKMLQSGLGAIGKLVNEQFQSHGEEFDLNHLYDQPILLIPENQPFLSQEKIQSLAQLYKILNLSLSPSPSSNNSSLEFYNLNLKKLTFEKLRTIEIPHEFKLKWVAALNYEIEIFNESETKKMLINTLINNLKTNGYCLFGSLHEKSIVADRFLNKIKSLGTPYEFYILNRLIRSKYIPSELVIRKLDDSIIDLEELAELLFKYYLDSLKLKIANYNDILKFERFDHFKYRGNEIADKLKNNILHEIDLLPPIVKPCFYLVRPPEEENPEIHCLQIYINKNYDIYAIGKESSENEVSNHLAAILGCERNLLLPSSYGEGFSLKNAELDLLWKYYAAHPEEFILLSSLSMQHVDEPEAIFSNSVKGKKGRKRSQVPPEPNSVPAFPEKLKAKRRKNDSPGQVLDGDATMEDPSQSASFQPSEGESIQASDASPFAVLPSMPLISSSYTLPEMNLSNPFASLMFKLTQQSMEFVKKHLEKVEKYAVKNDDQLFNITAPLRQKIGAQTHTLSQFYCAALKEYQQNSASWMLNMSRNRLGGILASEPGLGKTLIAIEWIMQQQKLDASHRPILVVVPKTIATQWRESLYQQNQSWLCIQFAQLIRKAKEGENIDLATLYDYLNIFLKSHLTEIAVLEKKLKGVSSKENGEDNPIHSYVKLQLETRQKWLQEAQNLYDDLFFNAGIIPHILAQWKKEINQQHLSHEERGRCGRKFALTASNIIEKMLLKDITDWNLRVEKGLKAFSLLKYGKFLNAIKPALQQKNPQEIRSSLCAYLFQFIEDIQNLGHLLSHLCNLPASSTALNSEIDLVAPISPEIGIRANFYSLVNVISEPPTSYAELTPLKANIEKPCAVLITTKDTLRIVKRNKQSASRKALEKRKEKEKFIEFLKTLPWGGVIWDEAQLQVWDLSQGEGEKDASFAYHFLKSLYQNSGANQGAEGLPIMLLTGTPFVNTYGETLSLFFMGNPNISLQSYCVEILNRESRLKSALVRLERAKKTQTESQEKNDASIKRCTRSFLKCLENVIVAYAHMKKVQSNLVRVNRFEDDDVQKSWTTEQGVKLLPQKEALEITCSLKHKQKELIKSIQEGFKSGEKSLFRLLDSTHKIVFHPELNGKKLVDRNNPELEGIKKKIRAFNPEEQGKFIEESGFLTSFFKGSDIANEPTPASSQISPFKDALKTPESILIIVSRIFEGVILKQLLENQFKYENRTNAKVWFFDGSTTTEQREHMVRSYETSTYFSKIFILSVKSGGVGLDLKSTTIGFNLASKWAQWNDSGLLQAEARMYRANTMGVKKMYTFNTGTLVEQCVHHAVVGKRLFSQFLFYSEESIKKEIDLYLNALEARCIKTEVDLSVENMEERKAKIHDLFEVVRIVLNEAPPKYFEAFQKRLSMATDLSFKLSQDAISQSSASSTIAENEHKRKEEGVKRRVPVERSEANKGKKNKTGLLAPSSNLKTAHSQSQAESKSSMPNISHSYSASPGASPLSVSSPLGLSSALTKSSERHSSAAAPLLTLTPSIKIPPSHVSASTPLSHSLALPLPTALTSPFHANASLPASKKHSFSSRVAKYGIATFQSASISSPPVPPLQSSISASSISGQLGVSLKTHYEAQVSGGNKISLSIVPLRDCMDIKKALQIGVGVSKLGPKIGSLLKTLRSLPASEWQTLVEDPEAFMKTNHETYDLNVNAVKTLVPMLFEIEQNASKSPLSHEEVLKNYNSDIYIFKDGKLVHEKGLKATAPSSTTCTIRLLKLPLMGNSESFKFHLLQK